MGFLNRLFGSSENQVPADRDVIHLAPGRGFTFNVVGESEFQRALSKICGGKKTGGHKHEATASLRFVINPHDPNAVAVDIDGKQVGWIPSPITSEIRREIAAVSPVGNVACKAKIVGGWDEEHGEGHFGVKLSLSRPLKLSTKVGG